MKHGKEKNSGQDRKGSYDGKKETTGLEGRGSQLRSWLHSSMYEQAGKDLLTLPESWFPYL